MMNFDTAFRLVRASYYASVASTASYCFFLTTTCISSPSWADTGYTTTAATDSVLLKSCPSNHNCVSSNYLEPPNRYVSPLRLVNDRGVAFQRAIRDLNNGATTNLMLSKQQKGFLYTIVDGKPDQYYIHLTALGTMPGSLDDIEFIYTDQGVVQVRCDARVTLPVPPFCLQKDCINGNMDQRTRMNAIALNILNLPPSDQQQMQQQAKWTPLFFNSDRVPGFYDDI